MTSCGAGMQRLVSYSREEYAGAGPTTRPAVRRTSTEAHGTRAPLSSDFSETRPPWLSAMSS